MSWKTLNTKLIEANPYLRFFVDEFETETGKKGKYYYHVNGYTDGFISVLVQKDINATGHPDPELVEGGGFLL